MNDTAADLRFVPLEADDVPTVDAWLRLTTESAEDVPLSAAPHCAADLTGSVRFAPPDTSLAGEVAFLGGQAVGALRLVLPDGAPVAVVDQLLTAPKERRQGIGTALFRRARSLAAEHGRTLLVADVVQALPGGPCGTRVPPRSRPRWAPPCPTAPRASTSGSTWTATTPRPAASPRSRPATGSSAGGR
ncbi:GNAT family N-acetyltransferase [Streptomyces sp. SL203]|nr:GNAT family N-acetyltransferase [Streptomyces sp. SL203]MCY1655008.1 GNAT family N-acetyltransferase [Streptomyces sp. SL203]